METEIVSRVIRSRRRTLALQVMEDARVVVRAPARASLESIQALVNQNLEWIRRQQRKIHETPAPPRRAFVTGETFLYLGRPIPLAVLENTNVPLEYTGNEFILSALHRPMGKKLFEQWYRAQAQSTLNERTIQMATPAGLAFTSLRISSARTRWGSCSSQGRLNFSWRLVLAPLWVIDYVVAHELAHLVHPNHSKLFWKKVSDLFPNFIEAKKWLRDNRRRLSL